jgi:hypothetical protein
MRPIVRMVWVFGLTVSACGSSSGTASVDTAPASLAPIETSSQTTEATKSTQLDETSSSRQAVESSSSTVAVEEPSATHPVGIIAIGHSGLTGQGTSGGSLPAPQNSWATGIAPKVDSVYERLVAVRPETLDHVANAAHGGALAQSLPGQAMTALRSVPYPALVIISTIDNDIRCDGGDAGHVPEFGGVVAQALDEITAASPNSKILIVGQVGRPSTSFIAQLVAAHPEVKASLTGSGICDFFDVNGNLLPQNFDTLTSIIDGYETEEARVCAAVPNCSTDGGLRAAYQDKIQNFSSDWAHLNIDGQSAEAELIWPAVKSILGL